MDRELKEYRGSMEAIETRSKLDTSGDAAIIDWRIVFAFGPKGAARVPKPRKRLREGDAHRLGCEA